MYIIRKQDGVVYAKYETARTEPREDEEEIDRDLFDALEVPCAYAPRADGEGWEITPAPPPCAGTTNTVLEPVLEEVQAGKLAALSAVCNAAITGGCDVVLSDGTAGHIALTAEDQINLTNAAAAVEGGAQAYPYHLDGELCALYPAADIMAMAQAATAHKLYHTTYYNHLAAWVRRCETAEEVQAMTYGAELPEDLAANMAAVLAAAGGNTDA